MNDMYKFTIAYHVRVKREEKRLTQEQLAALIIAQKDTIVRIETGQGTKLHTLNNISNVLGCHLKDFFEEVPAQELFKKLSSITITTTNNDGKAGA